MPTRSTVGAFQADLRAFSDQIGVGLGEVRRKVALDVFSKVALRTPVDTGRARLSWTVQDGAPSTDVAPEGAGGAPSPGAIGTQPFGVTFVANALPYIETLEFGHSKQAPQGMARLTLAETEAELLALTR